MSAVSLPLRKNWLLAALLLAMHVWLLAAAWRGESVAWLAAGCCLIATPALWALIHEGMHGHLLGSRRGGEALARVLGIAFGAPFTPLRFAHLLHHRCNRMRVDRPDVHDPAKGPYWRHAVAHFARLGGGQYLSEVSLIALAWLPRGVLQNLAARRVASEPDEAVALLRWADRDLLERSQLMTWRCDSVLISLAWLPVIFTGNTGWPLWVAFFASRGLMVSMLDNSFHHGTALDVRRDIRSLQTSPVFAALLLNFNLHRAHHANPSLPWDALPRHADVESTDPGLAAGLWRQWRGPVPIDRLPTLAP